MLVTRSTRREEETGRLEAVLAGRVARPVPALCALTLAMGAVLVVATGFTLGLVVAGVPGGGAALYAASLGALAWVFAGLAALVSQVTVYARSVYAWCLLALGVGYVLRGVGDVTGTWVTWLSPLGWAGKTAPFGQPRTWVLAIPLLVGLAAGAAAVALAARRDVGSALWRGRAGPASAGRGLSSPVGFAGWLHRPVVLGWLAGSVLLAATMGSLSQQLTDAMAGNPSLAQALGAEAGDVAAGVDAMVVQYLAILAMGYAVAAVGSLRVEEAAGRLEPRLTGTLSRRQWLSTHLGVLLGGLLLNVVVGSLVLAVATAVSAGDASRVGSILGAAVAYLPAEMVLLAVAVAALGLAPRRFVLVWALYAGVTFVAFLGPGLQLPGWVLDLAPTTHVGNPPQGSVSAVPLALLALAALAVGGAGAHGFRWRGIPQV